MSLRYKILAAVIGITVVVLSVVLAVILVELVDTKQEFDRFNTKFRENVGRWIGMNMDQLYPTGDELSPVVSMPLITDIVHVRLEEPSAPLSFIKNGLDVNEERVRSLVRRALAEGERGKLIVDGNEVVVPDKGDIQGPPRGGTWFRLDIPGFSPHEPLRKVYLFMLVGLVFIIVVIYAVLSVAVIKPIERLERAAKRVAEGDYSRPVPHSGRQDEVDTLIATFNTMMVELGNYRHHLQERFEDARRQARAAEKNLVIAQRLAATGKLASGIAHEVNNPLAGMQNAARRLLRDPPAEDKRREYLELIIDGLERVKETVKKILQFTPHQVAPQAVAVETVLRRALALASHRIEKEGTEVVVDVPETAHVFGDPFELQQVFLNILINAMDALAGTGRRGEIAIRAQVVDHEIRIAVEDNGCGMSDEQVSQAFDLFYTTKEVGEGTGLGLSIAHNVIQNHGGRIDLKSRAGAGTTVEISLPLIDGSV